MKVPSRGNRRASLLLSFRWRRCLLLRLGLGLRWLPPDWRCFCRYSFAIQISDATPTFYPDPMLLTHDAFYRAEDAPAQRQRTGSTRALAFPGTLKHPGSA